MHMRLEPYTGETPRHQVRELVCSYRAARDCDGRIVRVASLVVGDARTAVRILAPLMADQPVELCGVACLSARYRLLAWHVVSRGTRDSTPVSVPDIFVPAYLTPGTVALLVVHNHPSGDPTPSTDDVAFTTRLQLAARLLGVSLLDHLVLGEEFRYYSFREAGRLDQSSSARELVTLPTRRTRRACGS